MSPADPAADRGTGFVSPAYGERSLGEVIPAVAAALGSEVLPDPGWNLPSAPAYVVLLVDGLGARLLQRHAHLAPFLASLHEAVPSATAGVPSTTATSLTSMGTALPPGAHGMVGYTSRVPGSGMLLNALQWDKRVDPLVWQPHPTAFDRLSSSGVGVTVVSKREFEGSGLTVASQRGARYIGSDRVGERITAVIEARARRLGVRQNETSLSYVYEGDLDWTGHRYGVDSPQWRHQLISVDRFAQQLRGALDDDTRLVVIADHGMVDCPPQDRVDVDRRPELRKGLALLGGEARLRHLYAVDGAADELAGAWSEGLGERPLVLTRDEAIAAGWFGPVREEVLPRIGDVVVAARGVFGVFSKRRFPGELKLIGVHGSLTAEELLIPVLVG